MAAFNARTEFYPRVFRKVVRLTRVLACWEWGLT